MPDFTENKTNEGEEASTSKQCLQPDFDKTDRHNEEEQRSGDETFDEGEIRSPSDAITIYQILTNEHPKHTIEKIVWVNNQRFLGKMRRRKLAKRKYALVDSNVLKNPHASATAIFNQCVAYHEEYKHGKMCMNSVNQNFVFFCYKEPTDESNAKRSEIFVFTRGEGYDLINQKYQDVWELNHELPTKMAARLLDDRGYMGRKEMPCFGNTQVLVRKFSTFQKLSRMEPLAVILKYTGRVRPDSSFLDVASLKTACMVTVRENESNITFETKLRIGKFFYICDYLDKILKGEHTLSHLN